MTIVASVLAALGLGVGSGLAIAGIVEIEGPMRLRILDGCPTCPATFIGYAVADTWINQESSTTNYGAATDMSVQSRNLDRNRRALVAFDVSSLPANAQITSANIVFFIASQPVSARTYGVYPITAAWNESSVTWSNQPSVGATATDEQPIPNTAWMSWDVTADVAAMVAGTASYYGWEIRDTVEDESPTAYMAGFYSKEHADHALHPRLEIVYALP